MDLFFLKKLISALIMPLSVVLILLVIAIVFFERKPKLSRYSLISACIGLFLISMPPISDALIEPLEQKYKPFTDIESVESVDFIVVLGCGHTSNLELPVNAQVYPCSLHRAVEAFRIFKQFPQASIITSGNAFTDVSSNAEKVKDLLTMLGVPSEQIITEHLPKDTAEEALLIAPRLKDKTSVLVTNADHMPRSMNYFIEQGIQPIPAPTGHKVRQFTLIDREYDTSNNWGYYFPHVRNTEQTTWVWYEYLGLTVQWLKGLFTNDETNASIVNSENTFETGDEINKEITRKDLQETVAEKNLNLSEQAEQTPK